VGSERLRYIKYRLYIYIYVYVYSYIYIYSAFFGLDNKESDVVYEFIFTRIS